LKWAELDSNQRRLSPTDLQSVPIGHSGIRPTGVGLYRLEKRLLVVVRE
jgi:hypothetical protein